MFNVHHPKKIYIIIRLYSSIGTGLNYFSQILYDGGLCLCVSLSVIKKAYSTVWTFHLIHQLGKLEIRGFMHFDILKWFSLSLIIGECEIDKSEDIAGSKE